MKVGKIEIQGSAALPHISIRYLPMPTKGLQKEGLSLLLSTFGARLTRDDVLVPCFDMDEMRRRNMAKQKEKE